MIDQMYNLDKCYKISKTFYDDCNDCCCEIPEILKTTKLHYFISKNEDNLLYELRDRALLYADITNGYWEENRGLVLSARALLKVIGNKSLTK